MALTTVEVNKKSVIKNMDGQWSIMWELKGFDESLVELFAAFFSEDYKKGDNISRVETGFKNQMQNYINKYKKEQQLLNASQHDTAVTNVQTALEV